MTQEWGKSPLVGHTFTVHLLHEKENMGEKVNVLDLTPGLIRLQFVNRTTRKIAWIPLTQITSLYEDDNNFMDDDLSLKDGEVIPSIW